MNNLSTAITALTLAIFTALASMSVQGNGVSTQADEPVETFTQSTTNGVFAESVTAGTNVIVSP